jgi:hypothetical protein
LKVCAAEKDVPPAGGLQCKQKLKKRALACFALSHQEDEVALVDLEINVLKNTATIAVGFVDTKALNQGSGWPLIGG